jgi:hypothetical protein
VLARAGWRGAPVSHILDPLWLTSITTGAYILILGTLLFSYILGEQIAYKMVSSMPYEEIIYRLEFFQIWFCQKILSENLVRKFLSENFVRNVFIKSTTGLLHEILEFRIFFIASFYPLYSVRRKRIDSNGKPFTGLSKLSRGRFLEVKSYQTAHQKP